jgi:hypothetical protein
MPHGSPVEEGNHGKIVAIDLETGAFEVDAEYRYDLPSSPALLPKEKGARVSCLLSIWERVRGISANHSLIQQRHIF